MFALAARALAAAALAAVAAAQTSSGGLSILTPGGPNLWWVSQSSNTLSWTCKESQFQNFTILISNSDQTVLQGPQALIAIENNFVCSLLLTVQQLSQKPATGYTLSFANPFNETDIYASTAPFEIKAANSAFPPASATPTDPGAASTSASAGASGTSSASGSNASQTSSSKSGAGHAYQLSGALALALALVAAAVGALAV